MAFIPTPACVQARLLAQTAAGVVAENVFYCATTGVPTSTDLEAIGAAFSDFAQESYSVIMNTDWTMIGVQLRAMNEEEGLGMYYTDGFPEPGEAGGAGGGHQVTYTITWATGLVGRSARGRSYGIGLPSTYIASGSRLTDVGRTALQVVWNNLLLILNDAGHALQVVSFVEGGVPRTEGRKLPVLAANVRFPLATLRSRLT